MPLPAHLAKYGGLLDFLVEQFVREVEQGDEMKTPATMASGAGVRTSTAQERQQRENTTPSAHSAANPD